jgi:hypothetical protein
VKDVGWLARLLANVPVAAVLAMAAGMVPAGGQPVAAAGVVSGVAVATLPALARQSLRLVSDLTATSCPVLPPLWVVAQVQAESGWDAGLHSDQPGGLAGLYQLDQASWVTAGGPPWTSDPPEVGTGVLSPEEHLRIAVRWVCADLRAVTAHLSATGKPTAPLDAMLVCRVAGCARVTGSRTGAPAGGEAGCDERCAQLVQRYIAAVHNNLLRFAETPTSAPPSSLGAASPIPFAHGEAAGPIGLVTPAAWRGGATGCSPPDPTGSGGCLTGATRHGLEAVGAAFGGWRGGPTIHSTGCWDRHAWNPSSDHSRGKACDFMVTRPGTFAQGAELANGWKLAHWLRANAGPLQVKYVIWQGRYWDPSVRDDPGNWGTRYTGAGIYDVRTATGGHYDHVHASFRE